MAATHESSVVFALNELRDNEAIRAREKAARAHEMAELARRQADAAARGRQEAKRNADELIELRLRLEEAATQQADLQQALASRSGTNQALELRIRQLEAMPLDAPPLARGPGRSVHIAWLATLMLACLGVYALAHDAGVPEQPAIEQQAMLVAEPMECPTPPAQVDPAPVVEPAPLEPSKTSVKPKASGAGERQRPKPRVEPGLGTLVDPNCNGPLCGLPD